MKALRAVAWLLTSLVILAGAPPIAAEVSNLSAGEALVLIPASAHRSADGREWVVPLHAWVYVPQNSRVRRAAVAKILKAKYGLEVTPERAPVFDARVNLLLADNKRGRTVVVDVAGTRATLPETSPNGHARGEVRIPVSDTAPDGAVLKIRAVLRDGDARAIETAARLVGPTGRSVISDIDDTVKVTHVLDRGRMWEQTFYEPFAPVTGMPEVYRALTSGGAPVPVHYVSSSPWHLSPPLLEFIAASGLPLASITLKDFRLKDRTSLNILKPGRETKPPQIEAVLTRYPGRSFFLIGDSGEDDPEVYAEAFNNHPKQIERIYIRNITGARRDDARFSKTFAGIPPERWVLFDEPSEIKEP